MKQANSVLKFIIGLTLASVTFSALANEPSMTKQKIASDNVVSSQYLPITKISADHSTGYVFIDRASVKIHPYNKLIRTYSRVINYVPALSQKINDVPLSYQSKVIQEFVNCDKKEYVENSTKIYQNPFGTGKLYDTDNFPKRWEATTGDEKQRLVITVVCALPVNE
ncbi:surface-adhesin E family protein [Orbus sturtevantii]|uniref:surface-adhesin E family protein n=1 Tax=Orbus sturtevantii TaxID=3074109 RepID=UPI00370D06F5